MIKLTLKVCDDEEAQRISNNICSMINSIFHKANVKVLIIMDKHTDVSQKISEGMPILA